MKTETASKIREDEIIYLISKELDVENLSLKEQSIPNGLEDHIQNVNDGNENSYKPTLIFRIYRKFKNILMVLGLYKLFQPILFKISRVTPSHLRYSNKPILNKLLNYEGLEFLSQAFITILNREPDEEGISYYYGLMQSGKFSKIDIIGSISSSEEGRNGTSLKGYKFKYTIRKILRMVYKIPFVGYIVRMVVSVILLPRNTVEFRRTDFSLSESVTDAYKNIEILRDENLKLYDQLKEANEVIHTLLDSNTVIINKMASAFGEIKFLKDEADFFKDYVEKHIQGQIDKNYLSIIDEAIRIDNMKMDLGVINQHIEENMKENRANVEQTRSSLLDVNERLQSVKKQMDEGLQSVKKRMDEMQEVGLELKEEVYLEFENTFRGDRTDIKERLYSYGDYANILLGREDPFVLDVGCGRGEWLEYLRDVGIKAMGIDLNQFMVDFCNSIFLDVRYGDCVKFLEDSNEGEFDAITGFQVIEHIPFKTMFYFFNLCYKVLRPNGFVLFESPNLDNILVGASTFYSDPTHVNRLTPDSLKFYLEKSGFKEVEILTRNKRCEPEYTGQKYVDEIIYKINMEQDIAIVGYKS